MLAGLITAMYGVATMFAGGAASATRGVAHSRRYAVATIVVGAVIAILGLALMLR